MKKLSLWLLNDIQKNYEERYVQYRHKLYSHYYLEHMPWKYIFNWYNPRIAQYKKYMNFAIQCKIISSKKDSLNALRINMDFRKDWWLMLCEK